MQIRNVHSLVVLLLAVMSAAPARAQDDGSEGSSGGEAGGTQAPPQEGTPAWCEVVLGQMPPTRTRIHIESAVRSTPSLRDALIEFDPHLHTSLRREVLMVVNNAAQPGFYVSVSGQPSYITSENKRYDMAWSRSRSDVTVAGNGYAVATARTIDATNSPTTPLDGVPQIFIRCEALTHGAVEEGHHDEQHAADVALEAFTSDTGVASLSDAPRSAGRAGLETLLIDAVVAIAEVALERLENHVLDRVQENLTSVLCYGRLPLPRTCAHLQTARLRNLGSLAAQFGRALVVDVLELTMQASLSEVFTDRGVVRLVELSEDLLDSQVDFRAAADEALDIVLHELGNARLRELARLGTLVANTCLAREDCVDSTIQEAARTLACSDSDACDGAGQGGPERGARRLAFVVRMARQLVMVRRGWTAATLRERVGSIFGLLRPIAEYSLEGEWGELPNVEGISAVGKIHDALDGRTPGQVYGTLQRLADDLRHRPGGVSTAVSDLERLVAFARLVSADGLQSVSEEHRPAVQSMLTNIEQWMSEWFLEHCQGGEHGGACGLSDDALELRIQALARTIRFSSDVVPIVTSLADGDLSAVVAHGAQVLIAGVEARCDDDDERARTCERTLAALRSLTGVLTVALEAVTSPMLSPEEREARREAIAAALSELASSQADRNLRGGEWVTSMGAGLGLVVQTVHAGDWQPQVFPSLGVGVAVDYLGYRQPITAHFRLTLFDVGGLLRGPLAVDSDAANDVEVVDIFSPRLTIGIGFGRRFPVVLGADVGFARYVDAAGSSEYGVSIGASISIWSPVLDFN